MFETSKDILNLVLAFSVIWITVFICWFIYYIISAIKKVNDTINFFYKTLTGINELVASLKSKANGFRVLGTLIEKGIDIVERKISKSKKKKSKTKTKKTSSSKK